MTIASNGWSAVLAASSADVVVGMAVVKSGDGSTVVPATTAALAASPSGLPDGIAVMPAMARQSTIVMSAGILESVQVPMVGTGVIEFAVVDAAGGVVRSATLSAQTIGIARKDGSVAIDLTLAQLSSLVIGGSGILVGVSDGSVLVGDGITTSGHVSDVQRFTKATPASLVNGMMPAGIALATVPLLGVLLYASVGSTIAASVFSGAPGSVSWAVLNASARPTRKTAPDANDCVIGEMNAQGNLHILPWRPRDAAVVFGQPPFYAIPDGSTDCSTALRAAAAATALTDVQLNFSAKRLIIPKGVWQVTRPVYISQSGIEVEGDAVYSSHIRATNMVGPLLYFAPSTVGEFPHESGQFGTPPNTNAAIVKREVQVQNEHRLDFIEYGEGARVHGLAAFSLEMIVRIDNTTATARSVLLGSYGERLVTDPIAQAFSTDYATSGGSPNTNCVSFVLNTTAGFSVVQSPNSSLTADGNYHHLQFTWDGALMRIGIDGVNQTLTVAAGSASIAGTMVQQDYESVCLSGLFRFWGGDRSLNTADLHIAGLRISNSARAIVASPAAKYTEDANTMMLFNFDTYDGIFVVGRARGNATIASLSDAYIPHCRDNVLVNVMANVGVDRLTLTNFYGPAVDMNSCVNSHAKNLSTLSKTGVRMYNNCYKSYVENLFMNGLRGRSGLAWVGAANSMSSRNIYPSNFDADIVLAGAGDVTFEGSTYTTASNIDLWMTSCINVTMSGNATLSDEATTISGRTKVCNIMAKNVDALTMNGVQFSQTETTVPLAIVQGDGVFGDAKHHYIGAYLGVRNINTGIFDVKSTAPAGTISIHDCQVPAVSVAVPYLRTTAPDGVNMLITPDNGTRSTTTPVTGTTTTMSRDSYLRNRYFSITGALGAGNTLTVPRAMVGAKTFKNDTTGGFTVTLVASGGSATHAITPGSLITVMGNGVDLVRLA